MSMDFSLIYSIHEAMRMRLKWNYTAEGRTAKSTVCYRYKGMGHWTLYDLDILLASVDMLPIDRALRMYSSPKISV
jgi:hypothetical protein